MPLPATNGMRNELPYQQQMILTRCDKLKQFQGWEIISPYVIRFEEILHRSRSAAGLFVDIDHLIENELPTILEPSNLRDPRKIGLSDGHFPAELREDILSLLKAIYSHVNDIEVLCKIRLLSKRNNLQANACKFCGRVEVRSCDKVAAESNTVTTENDLRETCEISYEKEKDEDLQLQLQLQDLQDALSNAKQLNATRNAKLLAVNNERKMLHNMLVDMKGQLRVYIRIRPMNAEYTGSCAIFKHDDYSVSIVDPSGNGISTPYSCKFDSVYAGSATDGNSQEDVFKDTSSFIASVVDGYNVCIMTYGHTGALIRKTLSFTCNITRTLN